MHRLVRGLAAAAAASALALTLAPAGATPTAAAAANERTPQRTLEIKPARLDRGPDVQLPRLAGRTVVDGDRRVRVPGRKPVLLGRSGSAYVVVSRLGGRWVTQRVAPGRPARTLLQRANPESIRLSDDGAHLVVNNFTVERSTVVDVYSARNARAVAGRAFRGYVDVLGMDGDRVVLGGDDVRTRVWNVSTGASRRISNLRGARVDFGGDRLAGYTGDPYEGGCTRVVRLSRPMTLLWRSCTERVDSFSPLGRRMTTIGILADGIGPNRMWERGTRGRLFARYDVATFFGVARWESDSDFVVEAAGRKQTADVRCSGGVCERASALRPTPSF